MRKPKDEGWEKEFELALAYKKLNARLLYAEAKQYAFVESSEVYSAPYGIIS